MMTEDEEAKGGACGSDWLNYWKNSGNPWEEHWKKEFTPRFYYESMRDEVKREDEITHQRLTWSITFQGFLIAAVTFLISSPWTIPSDSSYDVLSLRMFTLVLVGIVGFLISLVSRSGINASRKALEKVKGDWEIVNNELRILGVMAPESYGRGDPFEKGSRFSQNLPIVFSVFWGVYSIVCFGLLFGSKSVALVNFAWQVTREFVFSLF